jgi:hypothetical protein
MIVALAVIAIILLVAGVVVAIQVKRYGSLRAAFSGELKSERQVLSEGRSRVARLAKQREAELRDAQRSHDQAQSSYNKRAAQAQAQVEFLENPGMGKKLGSLKDVKVYERSIKINGRVLKLAGGHVRVDVMSGVAILVFTHADGHIEQRSYDTSWRDAGGPTVTHGSEVTTVTQQRKRDFTPEEVHGFGSGISNAILAANRFEAELPGMRVAAAAELEAAVADTAAVESTLVELQRVQAGTDTVVELASAEQELQVLESRWAEVSRKAAPQPALV